MQETDRVAPWRACGDMAHGKDKRMDLSFTPEEQAFREEVREFFRTALPEKLRAKLRAGHHVSKDEQVEWQRTLNKKGWAVPHWPVEWGGTGWDPVRQYIFREELMAAPAPEPLAFNASMCGPVIIQFGSEEQKKRFLPRMANLDDWWCQGFSEPGSGSDLASLSTRAEQRGDEWVINGQKVWTSLAQFASRCVLLTRTAPGHKGITAFFVDMDTPGITVRPLRTMHGVDEFAEVYFDDVVVPADRMLGNPGDGWKLAMDLLPHERSTCFWHRIAYLFTRLDRLVDETDSTADDELGAAYLALHTVRCRSLATQQRLASGASLGPETSVDKILLATAEQQLFDTARDLLPGVLELSDTEWRTEFLYSRAATIYGGTAEIQRNIVARRLLDLGAE